ncbi:inward rectifier potassium channel 16 isoform X1 [Anguilla anguilla]|uniref:inward rectifier potassium channel 16 isoform X1 n=2 Tax=Anguilla anguilla TaxID=7936 RepID=UPI0015A89316|nr:inward rectifier potassium channel 16 isoform X1 [Anguilla anguilla]
MQHQPSSRTGQMWCWCFSRMSSTGVQYTTVQSSDRPVTLSVGMGPGQADRKPRYIQRDGSCRLALEHVPGHLGLYVTDIFTTLVEIRWRVMFLLFSLSYILSWLFFGLLFWIIALAHGDLVGLSDGPCVDNVRSFTAAFLFSLETQTTIGYGFRGMTENCAVAIALVTVQDVLSCFIDTVVIGIVVAKMASARKRAQTVGFSSCAVINRRDGHMCLSWRLGDFRKNHMVEGVATAQIVRLQQRTSGEVGVAYQDLPLQQSDILLATPTTVTHPIVLGSPLYGLSMLDLYREDFELVVSFTYTGDSTGILHQTRSSYRPAQIRWGARFKDVLLVNGPSYRADYTLFHETVPVQFHARSAQDQDRCKPDDPATTPALTNGQAPPNASPTHATP